MDWEIKRVNLAKVEHPHFSGAMKLDRLLFGQAHACHLPGEIRTKHRPSLFVALAGEQVVGFKLGYERKPGHYYSWMGGVDPDYRGKGIARALMEFQHSWLKSEGYKGLRTQTKNQWQEMIILNLKSGFQIIGTFTDDEGETKIIMEKAL
ncbi:MAG: GNAT family N-acetyltransferase [Bdellovibrionaceae bacterium]|nr:GNAT family N-acetyltransferase [Bdellovibrionales bacterium]MCB9086560.1 GNAT family N-acetyltransferase [Pseudobdellovibrionaceae bacterium]